MKLAWRVRELADGRGWGAPQLARAAGLDEKTVRNILAGRATRVDLETISRLADALRVPPGALWHAEPVPAWEDTAGSAGTASRKEVDDVLGGRWGDEPEPGLERVVRRS